MGADFFPGRGGAPGLKPIILYYASALNQAPRRFADPGHCLPAPPRLLPNTPRCAMIYKSNSGPAPRARPARTAALTSNCDKLALSRKLVYQYQRARIVNTYSDFTGAEDLQEFFFGYVYLPAGSASKFEKRDTAFIRIARGKLLRMMTSRELIDHLETVIALREMTARLDEAAASAAAKIGLRPGSSALSDSDYKTAYSSSSTPAERARQLDAVMKSFTLCREVINNIPFSLDDILRFTPKVFMRNSDLLDLCASAYRAFHKHKASLDSYGAALREREYSFMQSMFDGGPPHA